jgi:chaperone required for assembly of F1-ATPase
VAEDAGAKPAGKASLPKRFYKSVAVKHEGAGAALQLDGKAVRTPGKALLALPTAALAEAVAQEWRDQDERIDPCRSPGLPIARSTG